MHALTSNHGWLSMFKDLNYLFNYFYFGGKLIGVNHLPDL